MIEVTCSTCGSMFERRGKNTGKILCPACRLNKMRKYQKTSRDRKREAQSWKEIVELHHKELDKDYPEGLYSDPAESMPSEFESTTSS